ncbi:DNA-directed RNA polymerase subunit omega [Hydrogenivirga sp. 128-5-R1-1]|uniref:DNA-directed RNA polymerase subunit omega n=1 Tax=Hydrogenivirga sp. 128-5-R1-1 TaxID=392423 RepID=UPI00015F105D|nr:DNA-directed RNA polymerase subunit omega [Hydrogenivirga sp. 128-5-R1-1]EDP72934.1 RNA polymerase omega subunit [Hydrogenivirga sp. 128-5-R1-1]
MSKRPLTEEALKKVNNRYELVHAAAKLAKRLYETGAESFVNEEGIPLKKTVISIDKIAKGEAIIIKPEEIVKEEE